jgi:hypothetical protein
MQHFVLNLTTPESGYLNLYKSEGASTYTGTMQQVADAILKFYRKSDGDIKKDVHKFFLTVGIDQVYRIIITFDGETPKIEKEQLEL